MLTDGARAVAALLSPRSIVVVGASERSRWSTGLLANLHAHGFDGPVHLVNRRGSTVGGQQTATSCAAIGEQVDLAVVLVPANAVLETVDGLAGAGVRSAVVLTSGFAEVGGAGADLQQQVLATARNVGVRLLGPNSLGFMNFAGRVLAWATPVKAPSRRSGVAVVSQSGATAYFLAGLAHQQDIGLSHVVATGNEADLDGADVIRYLASDESARAIAVFAEAVRDPRRFVDAADAVRDAGKPLVVLKVGASEATARSALAHTGALVGDDRVFSGVCERHEILRVHSMEQLLTTAEVIGRTGVLRDGGLCVVSNSGGVCEIAADAAQALGIDLPDVPDDALPILRDAMPDFATPHNPLDLTGAITPEGCAQVIAALCSSSTYAAMLVPFYPVPVAREDVDERLAALYHHLTKGLRDGSVPGFLVSYTAGALSGAGRELVAEMDLPYLACGLDRALSAIAAAFRFSRWQATGRGSAPVRARAASTPKIAQRPRSEHQLLALMREHGVPVIPQILVSDAPAAVAAARRSDGPVALKLASPDIAHKSEIGAVALGVRGEAEVADAFERVLRAGERQTDVTVDGVLVSPMRTGGVELFVGCFTDPVWGPVITVALGGIWVEVLSDAAIRPLPVGSGEVAQMLRGLRGARLLAGERGIPKADLDAVGGAVAAIGELALKLAPDLAALDVNPLWVCGERVEALDALAVWNR